MRPAGVSRVSRLPRSNSSSPRSFSSAAMRPEIAAWVRCSLPAAALKLRSWATQIKVSRKRIFMAFPVRESRRPGCAGNPQCAGRALLCVFC
ncbi:Uncharacterised protein [Bordetella pertussis]|nr:Uncharacterised protein [Bordetella pertussis]CFW38969.1 Uncharacterised protein [Bordetella pertussis]